MPTGYLLAVVNAAGQTGSTAPALFWENAGFVLQLLNHLPTDNAQDVAKAQDVALGFLRGTRLPPPLLPEEFHSCPPEEQEEIEAHAWLQWEDNVRCLQEDVLTVFIQVHQQTQNGESWLEGFKALTDFVQEVKRQHPDFGHLLWEELDDSVDHHWLGPERSEMLRCLRDALASDENPLPYRHFRGPPSVSSRGGNHTSAPVLTPGQAWHAARPGESASSSLLPPPSRHSQGRSGGVPGIALQSPSNSSAGPASVPLRSEHTSALGSETGSGARARSSASEMVQQPLLGSTRGLLSALDSPAASLPAWSSPALSPQWRSPAHSVQGDDPTGRPPSRTSNVAGLFDGIWLDLGHSASGQASPRRSREGIGQLPSGAASRATSTSEGSAGPHQHRVRRGFSQQVNPVVQQLLQNFLRDSQAAARQAPRSALDDLAELDWPPPDDPR